MKKPQKKVQKRVKRKSPKLNSTLKPRALAALEVLAEADGISLSAKISEWALREIESQPAELRNKAAQRLLEILKEIKKNNGE